MFNKNDKVKIVDNGRLAPQMVSYVNQVGTVQDVFNIPILDRVTQVYRIDRDGGSWLWEESMLIKVDYGADVKRDIDSYLGKLFSKVNSIDDNIDSARNYIREVSDYIDYISDRKDEINDLLNELEAYMEEVD